MQTKDSETRAMRQGFGDALSMAFELVATPALFAYIGLLVDRALGTVPLFVLLFSLIVLAYTVWKTFKSYERRMQRIERKDD